MAQIRISSIGSKTKEQDIYSAPVEPTVTPSLLTEGKFISLNSSGKIILADYRNSQGKPVARGVLWQNNLRTDFRGNAMDGTAQMSYVVRGKIGNCVGLVPGASYYLSSGGGFQSGAAGVSGDYRQLVGYAETPTSFVIKIGDPVLVP
jgi:hypothetical protein